MIDNGEQSTRHDHRTKPGQTSGGNDSRVSAVEEPKVTIDRRHRGASGASQEDGGECTEDRRQRGTPRHGHRGHYSRLLPERDNDDYLYDPDAIETCIDDVVINQVVKGKRRDDVMIKDRKCNDKKCKEVIAKEKRCDDVVARKNQQTVMVTNECKQPCTSAVIVLHAPPRGST